MSNQQERRFVLGVMVVFCLLITLPYVIAAWGTQGGAEFGGFLLNPLDGNSYLAKMYQGLRGDWLFTLPYTAEKSNPVLLYTFYIFLGHVARLTRISLVMVFHAARLAASVFMLWMLYRFLKAHLASSIEVGLAFVFAAFGSGLGWLLLPISILTSDYWVAEAYPFLSAYTNPHFPLSLGLMLYLLLPLASPAGKAAWLDGETTWTLLAALALSALSPFGVVLACAVWASLAFVNWIQSRYDGTTLEWRGYFTRLAVIALGGLPLILYDLRVIYADPLLSGWNAQNITPAPPVWDIVLSLAPMFILAPYGLRALQQRKNSSPWLLPVWLVVGLLLLYLPWDLQRRFLMGIFVPVAALAAAGLVWLGGERRRILPRAAILLLLALPTNLLLLQAARHGIQTQDARLYLTSDEVQALAWIESNTRPDAVILAASDTGMFIPAHTGRRVIYGHPFETVNAVVEQAHVEHFFSGSSHPDAAAALRRSDYVFYSQREMKMGEAVLISGLRIVYQNASVTIYKSPE